MLKNNIPIYCDCNLPLNKSIKSLISHWISKYIHSSSMMDDDKRYIDKYKTISTQCFRSSKIIDSYCISWYIRRQCRVLRAAGLLMHTALHGTSNGKAVLE